MAVSSFVVRVAFAAVGASFTAVPVNDLLPVTVFTPSDTLVAIVKLPLALAAGVKVKPANNAFTSAVAPLALHTPVLALYVEVTLPDVAVLSAPAATLDKVRVAVWVVLSLSVITISTRFNATSSVYASDALKLVIVGAALDIVVKVATFHTIPGLSTNLTCSIWFVAELNQFCNVATLVPTVRIRSFPLLLT